MAEIAAIVLAAGRATRFGSGPGDSKVFSDWNGAPLVRHVVTTALASKARPTIVVTGHAAARMEAALDGLAVTLVDNPDYATGMASSLKAGLDVVPSTAGGALILLADMPLITRITLDRLVDAFALEDGSPDAVVPVHAGRRGNPVLIGRALFAAVASLDGDEGARKLLKQAGRRIVECAVEDQGIAIDVDTPETLRALP